MRSNSGLGLHLSEELQLGVEPLGATFGLSPKSCRVKKYSTDCLWPESKERFFQGRGRCQRCDLNVLSHIHLITYTHTRINCIPSMSNLHIHLTAGIACPLLAIQNRLTLMLSSPQ